MMKSGELSAYLGTSALLLCGSLLGNTDGLCALGGSGVLGCHLGGLGLCGALDSRFGVDGLKDARLGVAGRRACSFACHFV